jgi:adenine-specific DNA-methyltransferase
MFSEAGGQVFLSDWATDQQLAEATAAQLHFEYYYEPPFCGLKGRSRLAVVDGLVNESVARLLAGALPEGESVVICGTAVDPRAQEALEALRPGSTVRKIPQSLLRQYRRRQRWLNQSTAPSAEVAA